MSVMKDGHLPRKVQATDDNHARGHIALIPKLVFLIADILGILKPWCEAKIKVNVFLSVAPWYKKELKNENQLDATYYFIVLLIGSTCFGHYHAHHQELTAIMLIATLVVSFLLCCWLEVRCGWAGLVSGLQAAGHYSSLPAPYLQHTTNQERNDQCGNLHYSRELLMMGIVAPETCWAYKKYDKIIRSI